MVGIVVPVCCLLDIYVQASTKTECGYLNCWIEKTVTYAKISPEMVNPRYIAGERRRRRFVSKQYAECISQPDLLRNLQRLFAHKRHVSAHGVAQQ